MWPKGHRPGQICNQSKAFDCAQIVPERIGIGGELCRLNRVELLRGFNEIAFAHDVVALERFEEGAAHAPVLTSIVRGGLRRHKTPPTSGRAGTCMIVLREELRLHSFAIADSVCNSRVPPSAQREGAD